jgi:hypothetical protein
MDNAAARVKLTSDAISLVRGETVRRAARGVALSLGVAIISEAFVMSTFPFFWTSLACLFVATIGAISMRVAGMLGGRPRCGTIEVGRDVIEVRRGDDVTRHRLDELEQGAFREPDGLVLRLSGGLELRAHATRGDAEALLDRAGLSARQRTLRVALASVAPSVSAAKPSARSAWSSLGR